MQVLNIIYQKEHFEEIYELKNKENEKKNWYCAGTNKKPDWSEFWLTQIDLAWLHWIGSTLCRSDARIFSTQETPLKYWIFFELFLKLMIKMILKGLLFQGVEFSR